MNNFYDAKCPECDSDGNEFADSRTMEYNQHLQELEIITHYECISPKCGYFWKEIKKFTLIQHVVDGERIHG